MANLKWPAWADSQLTRLAFDIEANKRLSAMDQSKALAWEQFAMWSVSFIPPDPAMGGAPAPRVPNPDIIPAATLADVMLDQMKALLTHASNPDERCVYSPWVADNCRDCQRLSRAKQVIMESDGRPMSEAQIYTELEYLIGHEHAVESEHCRCKPCKSGRYRRVAAILLEVFA